MKELAGDKQFVSIIIPCRNEEKFISQCLDSILANDYPKENLEILVIDGVSEDGTREIVKRYIKQYPYIKLLNNPKKYTPFALNIGIKRAKGEIIMRMDTHTLYAKDYISKCVEYLKKTEADCVGGPMRAMGDSYVSRAIAFIHHSRFGIGVGKFHNENCEGYVDTVYLGCYRKEVFGRVGLFNEKLIRNQDIEFNARLKKANGKIFLTPGIKSYYYCRSNLKGLWEQNYKNGLWNIYTIKIAPGSLSPRHIVPACFVTGLLGSLILIPFILIGKILFYLIAGSYLLANLFFSLKISTKKGLKYLPLLPLTFFILHFSYGLGSIWGLLTFWKIKK